MDENNQQFDIGDYPRPRQPWFGRKTFGYGYGPRTWQGYLVTAVLALFAVLVATLTKGHFPGMLIGIVPLIGVPFLIMAIQRR
jgi:hypothetical protein